ncbi:MAG: 50S ribosomal protein L9 [Gemmatimonadales bacterium]|nr:50S ribosomal protein L9 [Gemmatimonadales bacterium]MBA3556854.1 50S ribosomal protein L9 [Gemmatimonadales bacterium]
MEVILREDVKSLGRTGEMVRVKPGYARNYLLPQGLAYEASEGNKKRIAAETKARTTRDQAERTEAERFAATLNEVSITLTGKAGEEGKLFGSITSQDIADALAAQGQTVDRRRIELEHPIKTLGHHTVAVRVHPEVHAELRVSVVAE